MVKILARFKNHSILRTTLWSGINISLQYIVGFFITVLIASHVTPIDFGIYQIALSFLALFEVLHPIQPNHARNLIAEDERLIGSLIGSWHIGTLLSFFACFLISLIVYFTHKNGLLGVFVVIAAVKILFRYNEYSFVINDYFGRSELSQKVQILQHLSFNLSRSLVVVGIGVRTLMSLSLLHGLMSFTFQWLVINRKLKFGAVYNRAAFIRIVRSGSALVWLSILLTLQQKAFAFVLPNFMSLTSYGSFHLILKFLEPVMVVPTVVLNANFSVLAKTRIDDIQIFTYRFRKLAVLILILTLLGALAVYFVKDLIMSTFNEGYDLAAFTSVYGMLLVVSSAIFQINLFYSLLSSHYRIALSSLVIALFSFVIGINSWPAKITVDNAIGLYAASMLFSTSLSLIFRWKVRRT